MSELNKPKTTKLVIHQASHTPYMWVTNLQHEPIGVNFFLKKLAIDIWMVSMIRKLLLTQ